LELLELLRIVGSVLLVFIIPGYLLILALFPERNQLDEEDDLLYRMTYAFLISVGMTVVVTFILGSIPVDSAGRGWIRAETVASSLIVLSILFFVFGVFRGAYREITSPGSLLHRIRLFSPRVRKVYKMLAEWRDLKDMERNVGRSKKAEELTDKQRDRMKHLEEDLTIRCDPTDVRKALVLEYDFILSKYDGFTTQRKELELEKRTVAEEDRKDVELRLKKLDMVLEQMATKVDDMEADREFLEGAMRTVVGTQPKTKGKQMLDAAGHVDDVEAADDDKDLSSEDPEGEA